MELLLEQLRPLFLTFYRRMKVFGRPDTKPEMDKRYLSKAYIHKCIHICICIYCKIENDKITITIREKLVSIIFHFLYSSFYVYYSYRNIILLWLSVSGSYGRVFRRARRQ